MGKGPSPSISGKLSKRDIQAIIRRHRSGESLTALGVAFGVTKQAIYYHLKRTGNHRRRETLSRTITRSAHRRWLAGETISDIARELGVAARTLHSHVNQLNGQPLGRFKKASVRLPTQRTKLAYLAAIIDGEGCISRGDVQHRQWQVTITNTSPELKRWLRPLGGRFYWMPRQARPDGTLRRPIWVWKVVAARDVLAVLRAVLPFLVIKRAKAELVIEDITKWVNDVTPR
ncbi:MAG: hypothetical protein M3277_08845 [Actinomycetota bacterium]|nr:hypothetical protein [Actinomycetota bacterium]